MFARQRSHRWQAAAIAFRRQPPLRLTVAQEPIQEKSNEIPALKPLLRKLPKGALEGTMITADALHCQQESSTFHHAGTGSRLSLGPQRQPKWHSWSALNSSSRKIFFPSEYDTGWIKEHGRLVRWRLQRVSLSPEEAGLCGCWQFVAVWRERKELRQGKVTEESEEYSFYCTSAAPKQYSAQQLLQIIRNHWSSSENGAHYRRDVSLGEDASASASQRRLRDGHVEKSALGTFRIAKAPRQNQGSDFSGMAPKADQHSKNATPHAKLMNTG